MEDNDIVPYKEKKTKIHICNCSNEGKHDPSAHSRVCNYYRWWTRRNAELHREEKQKGKE